MSTSWFLWAVLFGSVGLGFIVYARRQRSVMPLICGTALLLLPYLVTQTLPLVLLGFVLMAIPYFFRV